MWPASQRGAAVLLASQAWPWRRPCSRWSWQVLPYGRQDTWPAVEARLYGTLPPATQALSQETNSGAVARNAAQRLRASGAALQLGGQALAVEACMLPVVVFVGNSTAESDEALHADMAGFGAIERCFVMRNPAGQLKARRVPSAAYG